MFASGKVLCVPQLIMCCLDLLVVDMQVVAALYCNPIVVIDILQKLTMPPTGEPVIGQFFTQWFQHTNTIRGY